MENPEFPKPRIIREDFLPELMKNYRIKKVTEDGQTVYYPQKKYFFWWYNIFAYEVYFDGGYDTLEEARKRLCEYCRKPVVEYLNFDPNVDCK